MSRSTSHAWTPSRYDRKKGKTGYDLAVERVKRRQEAGEQSTAQPITGLPVPQEESTAVINWCEPMEAKYLMR